MIAEAPNASPSRSDLRIVPPTLSARHVAGTLQLLLAMRRSARHDVQKATAACDRSPQVLGKSQVRV